MKTDGNTIRPHAASHTPGLLPLSFHPVTSSPLCCVLIVCPLPRPKVILLFKPTDRLCFKSLNLCLVSEWHKTLSLPSAAANYRRPSPRSLKPVTKGDQPPLTAGSGCSRAKPCPALSEPAISVTQTAGCSSPHHRKRSLFNNTKEQK